MTQAASANAPENAPETASGADAFIGQVEQFSDPAQGEAPPAQQDQQQARNDDHDADSKPLPFVGDEERGAFYKRLRERTQGKRDAPPAADGINLQQAAAPFALKEGDAPADDEGATVDAALRGPAEQAIGQQQPAQQQIAPEKTYELKVNGNTFTANRGQLLDLAGVSEDEAQGVPDSALVRAAQINEAARQRLIEAKSRQVSEPADRQAQQPHQADGNGHNADGGQQDGQRSTQTLSEAELARLIQYGDEEEAAAAQREFIRREMRAEQQTQRVSQVRMTVDQALQQFESTNSDLVSNADAMEVLTGSAIAEVRDALIKAGANPQHVANLSGQEATAVYSQAVARGTPLPPVAEILERAETKTRRLFNLPKNPAAPQQRPTPQQQPQPSAFDRRMAAKAALPQTPQRAGNPAPTAPVPTTRQGSLKGTLNWMREQRGQSPL